MTDLIRPKPPVWFWIIVGVLILWNIMGCLSWVMDLMMSDEMIAQMPPEQAALYAERPGWIIPVYAVAVFGALLGSVLLLMRNELARLAYIISLVMVVVQFGYVLFVMNAIGTMGFMQAAAFPIVIFLAGVFEIWFSGMAIAKGWTGDKHA